ncbi:Pol polyprotein [Thelohanellus kitauei]|uniref:Pol polyprotein n=1 Tax=Thelohanellus kitauei TaxID=669202 RepID=A0A0C2MFM3_THEKT|nr:Pol polyprotein [Thelohanellus kitauei]
MVVSCNPCSENSKLQNRKYISWPRVCKPFERVHNESLGPFENFVWLILVDSFSQFPFVVRMNGFTTSSIVQALKPIFAILGYPQKLVPDNGRQFMSSEFKDFCVQANIRLIFSPPYHPESNGLAERFVLLIQSSVSKSRDPGLPLDDSVFEFLLTYPSTHLVCGKSLSKLIHGRQMRNELEA